jgi:hypothetical protein
MIVLMMGERNRDKKGEKEVREEGEKLEIRR